MTGIYVDIVYTKKLKKIRLGNVIYTTLTKIEMIIILPTSIKTFFGKDMRINAILKYKISTIQLGNLKYWDKKTTRYINIF